MNKNSIIIEPQIGWRVINWKELYEYRDLFYFLVWKDLKVRYAQSILGIGWAVIQPVFSMLVFTIVFGRLANISSDGAPYAIFSFVALVPWTYFSNSVQDATASLVSNRNMLTKVYIPRLMFPLTSVIAKLVDYLISLLILIVLMFWFQVVPTAGLFVIPLLTVLMMFSAAGIGMWLSALAVQYRDVKYGSNFVIQLLMYISPVVYATSIVPEKYVLFYALNPMVGIIEGFRSAVLGTNPMPWLWIGIGTITSGIMFITGVIYFKRMERSFADVA